MDSEQREELGQRLAAGLLDADELRAISMMFLMGVTIGELFTLGYNEAEIREGFESAMRARAGGPRLTLVPSTHGESEPEKK